MAVLGVCAIGIGCGGDGSPTRADGSAEGTSGIGTMSATMSSSADGPTESGGATDSVGTTMTTATSADTSAAASSDGDGPKFDVNGGDDDLPLDPCDDGKGGGGGVDFTYIWIADSTQNAVSKIHTQTLIEEGRYLVHPGAGNPSRTSVSLSGDVAIANRAGGLTKVYASTDECVESNGMAGIQTSTGGMDVLPWGVEECIAWHVPMNYSTQRPVAWSPGDPAPGGCGYVNEKAWTTGAQNNVSGSVETVVVDGDTGVIEQIIPMPEIQIGFYGAYGGAFDPEGDYWFVDAGNDGAAQELVRVNHVTYTYEIWTTPPISPYGFTVDTLGRPWIAGFSGGVSRFDPTTEMFDTNAALTGLGIQEDADGIMWMAHYPWDWEGVYAIDRDSMALVNMYPLPSNLAKGVSIDFDGYVWVVDQGTSAFRVDPGTGAFDTFTGLTGPYTYSDMTGWGLKNVTNPEG
ncbi:MAG TPA: hypothetical protein VG755_12000 [Nannocystaceae bacterium]|nr:hypothetical protein [Nannocystaceae bacterium]